MLSASTIELLRKHRPNTCSATALYLTAFNYLLEPFVNPEMTNPMAVTCSVYIGYGILRLWETYIVDCLKLDKDLFLPSYRAAVESGDLAQILAPQLGSHTLDAACFDPGLITSWQSVV